MLTRDDNGQVRALWYVSPDAVSVQLTQAGKLRYTVTPVSGGAIAVPDGGMLHIVGPLSADGYLGRSVVATAQRRVGLPVGHIGTEPALFQHHRLAAARVVAELA